MRIYSMTATFGKLEHATLILNPGFNVVEAPNEWGKSTWCAFLVNMLYGVDTKARTTGTALADKEHYAPWSGAAMSGRIDLNWNGRDITIERRTKGRVIFGDFKAYETATGVDVPELNSANCGQMLLGVERSVFARAGFIKFSDLPVTHDDALRRRLNNLVTTGDESNVADTLGTTLKDLKNKCRFNRSGLLPQAEAEKERLDSQLDELYRLQEQSEKLLSAQQYLQEQIRLLENHRDALDFAAAQEDQKKVLQAETVVEQAKQRLKATMEACSQLQGQEQAQHCLHQANALQESWMALQMESQMLPPLPEEPDVPERYRCQEGVASTKQDVATYMALKKRKKKTGVLWALYAFLVALALGTVLYFRNLPAMIGAGCGIVLGFVVFLLITTLRNGKIRREIRTICDRYAEVAPEEWIRYAEDQKQRWDHYTSLLKNARRLRGDLDQRIGALQQEINALTGGKPLAECQKEWAKTIAAWDSLGDARRDLQRAESHAQTLRAMARVCQPPKGEDTRTETAEQTRELLAQANMKQRELNIKLGQCQGQAEALGTESRLKARREALNGRIARLEDIYYALEMAQDALREASNTLQRRFAPPIAKRAQELLAKMTDGRYSRLTLGQDFALSVSAENEDTLHSIQWRSDGTADQLYFVLRLAVAEKLTPEAPLVLDDALVRFDEKRLTQALKILQLEAADKQVILFTCQSRERNVLNTL